MLKVVKIRLGSGSVETGFPDIDVQLTHSGQQGLPQNLPSAKLPAAPDLARMWQLWQDGYPALAVRPSNASAPQQITRLELNINPQDTTNRQFSEPEWRDSYQRLPLLLNQWLNSEGFREAEMELRTQLQKDDEVRIIIEVPYLKLCQLPWNLWNFFTSYPQAELSFCHSEYHAQNPKHNRQKVRILALLGDLRGVDVEGDLKALEQLPGAEVTVVKDLTHEKLHNLLWDVQGWDILFYGGHSRTDEGQGRLFINPTESLTLDKFSEALKEAISHGLQLAIFNSCDGMGLASITAKLGLPATIMMLQPVPNGVAVEFAQHFLGSFIRGRSCYGALRDARRRLQGIENKFICASWIPSLFCNPTAPIPTWHKMRYGDRLVQRKRDRKVAGLTSIGVAIGVICLGSLGALQPLDLKAYDWLLTHRPNEPPDPRILIVEVTSDDQPSLEPYVKVHNRYNVLPEPILEQLLKKLKQDFQPRVIGIDVLQQYSPTLKKWMKADNILAVCGTEKRNDGSKDRVFLPPQDVSPDQVGFSDFSPDEDNVQRRFVYEASPNTTRPIQPICEAEYAFSLKVALTYLEKQHYPLQRTKNDDLQVGSVVLKNLEPDFGGYQLSADLTKVRQVLLNYRAGGQAAQSIPLTDILHDRLKPEQIKPLKNRLVVVGGDINDHHSTPYGTMPGVIVQAHMISQLLSSVINGRTLITTWPAWGETLWVVVWSGLGSLVLWFRRQPILMIGINGTFLIVLGVTSYWLLCLGIWVPAIAPIIALVMTTGGLWVYQICADH